MQAMAVSRLSFHHQRGRWTTKKYPRQTWKDRHCEFRQTAMVWTISPAEIVEESEQMGSV